MKLKLNFPLPFVNGLRRALISYVPSFSLNTKFIENETSYNDDILRLRISMIPVKEHLVTRLEKENTTKDIIKITSSDFENINEEHIMPGIFLFDLKPNQKIIIECETEKGFGFQNARWQVIQTPIMKKIETVEIKKNYDLKLIQEHAPELLKNNKIDKNKCLIDRTAVERINEFCKIITFKHKDNAYELEFEADYYSEIYCLHHALEYLKQLFSPKNFEYEIIHHPELHILKFPNKCHTLGNILQYYLQQECKFASYTKPHYLDDFILVKFDNEQEVSILEKIRKQILQDLVKLEQFCIS